MSVIGLTIEQKYNNERDFVTDYKVEKYKMSMNKEKKTKTWRII